ncbi:MAG: glycosyltransferase [Planctomycetota bacterium]
MVHYLLCAVGSSGDVHPFVGLGQRLQRRGHRVSLITAGYFRQLAISSGFDFYDTMPECDFHQLVNDPDLWHPTKGTKRVMQLAVRKNLEPTYRAIERLYKPGATRVVASSLAFGARVAQEKLGAPLVSVHLSPVVFRSEFQGPRLPRLALHLGPRWFKRFQWWVADRCVIDPMICPWLNEFRGQLGLAPVRGIFRDWWHSPQRVLGFFPDWFSPKQPDWPTQTVLTGFPLYSEEGLTPMPSELERFLDSGPPPIAFTPGSANIFGQKCFQAAAGACTRLGKRGILLTRFAEQIPTNLPENVKHFDYAPFKELLPRCEALVHHGGIGSLSQAMAAGIGQVIMPMGFDQIDNAYHIKRLGVGDYLAPSRFDGNRLASTLKDLLGNPRTAPACKQVASRIAKVDSLELTCDVIESSS